MTARSVLPVGAQYPREHGQRCDFCRVQPSAIHSEARIRLGLNGTAEQASTSLAMHSASDGWILAQDRVPECLPDGRRFSREVIAVDMAGSRVQRIARVHYYDNMAPVWDGGDPTHWRELADLPVWSK